MLKRLTVANYALINELAVDFHNGLNSVTGETGAGKSIILGALGLIIGNRADFSVLKNKEKKCVVEGTFQIENYKLHVFFEKNDLDYDAATIMRREITPSGKSRAFINDTPVNLKVMRELGLKLIDIHSQHQNLELANHKFQLILVDTVAGAESVLIDYQKVFQECSVAQKELDNLKVLAEKSSSDLDYYQFQFNQLDEAKLEKGEQIDLEVELEKLNHAGEIKSTLTNVQQLLDGEQFSAIQKIKESEKLLGTIGEYIPEILEMKERLQSSFIEIQDILDEVAQIEENTEHNPTRIEFINQRLNTIYSLQQKHNATTINELLDLKDRFDKKINEVAGYDDEIKALEKKLDEKYVLLEKKADKLTKVRKDTFSVIENAVLKDLRQLGMPKSKFNIVHEQLTEFGRDGRDSVSFLFTANADIHPAEISKIASGGEMSRLMLAIKNILRNSKSLPTIIFDEIDSGVSGEIALKMGNILKSFSESAQIINITHLPQIAAKGDTHFKVYKYEQNSSTFTSIKLLTGDERIEELAKMVGGEKLSDSTLKTAKLLMKD